MIALAWTSISNAAPATYAFTVDEDNLNGAPDYSWLNTSLEASDRIVVHGGTFRTIGADGLAGTSDDRRVRIYGINLSFSANFPKLQDAPRIARRLRKLGINAVRLHHLDTAPGEATDPPRSILTPGPYPSFNTEAVARLRHFISALAREGIYVNLNLHVGYRFRPDIDGVPPFKANDLVRPLNTPIIVYDEQSIALQEIYARELIRRLDLNRSPALAMVEINNESSLLASWQEPGEWGDAVPEAYQPALLQKWNEWLVRRYGSREAACKAWQDCPGGSASSLLPLLAPADTGQPSSLANELIRKVTRKLSTLSPSLSGNREALDRVPATGKQRRLRDFLMFLADTDRAYFDRLARVVRQEAGEQVPVTGTQMSYGNALNLASHRDMDYIDAHFYVDHPHFPQGLANDRNWRVWDTSLTGSQMRRLLDIALMRDMRKPFVVSEYNQPFPNRQGAEILPIMATLAARQDWDGLFFFDYGDIFDTTSGAPGNFALRGDWGKYVQFGQSAWMFRTGAIPALGHDRSLSLDTEALAGIAASRASAPLQAYARVLGNIGVETLWQGRLGMTVSASAATPRPDTDTDPSSVDDIASYDPEQKTFTLRAPRAWALAGLGIAAGNDTSSLRALVDVTEAFPFSILLTPLDNEEISRSRALLLSLGSGTVGSQPGSVPPRPKRWIRHPAGSYSWTLEPDPNHPGSLSGSRYATPPAWLTTAPVHLRWATHARKITVYPLDGRGQRLPPLEPERARVEAGFVELDLRQAPEHASPWYEIIARDQAADSRR
ncbi:MAG: capsular biosynthesis protein [Pigmentiphaga sp.]|uniref:capsular biosynthesis protein n=1 Tax=Pigmentiphaga TaxID=152267 RepID=UPI0031DF33F5